MSAINRNEERLISALNVEQSQQLASLLRILLLSFDPIAPEDSQHPSRWIGASLAPAHVARHPRRSVGLPDTTELLLVQTVAVPSPAAQAGLQEGDLIVFADGTEVRSIASLHKHLLAALGSALTLEVLRGTEHRVPTYRSATPPTIDQLVHKQAIYGLKTISSSS